MIQIARYIVQECNFKQINSYIFIKVENENRQLNVSLLIYKTIITGITNHLLMSLK